MSLYELHAQSNKIPLPPAMKGFEFRQRRDALNWRLLASVDVDKIVKNVDITALQSIVENICFCGLDTEDLENVDPTFTKLFQLSQMIIEYLLHSQDYILESRNKLRSDNKDLLKKLQSMESTANKEKEIIEELKRELKNQKKTLYAYQLMAKIPGGIGDNAHASTALYYRCEYCPKTFNSSFYLDGHLQRRHADKLPQRQNVTLQNNTINADLGNINDIQKITNTVEQFASRVIETERQFRQELELKMEEKLTLEVQRRQNLLEEGYKQERLRYSKEIQDLKTALHKDLQEEKLAFKEQKASIEAFMKNARHASHLGTIEDDEETTKTQQNQSHKLSSENLLLSTFESKQAKALIELQERMQKELDTVKSKLSNEQASENTAMENRLNAALGELKVLQSALVQEKKRNSVLPTSASDKPNLHIITTPIVSKSNGEYVSKPGVSATLRVSSPGKKQAMNEIWEDVLKKLRLHKNISNAEAPWAKSLFNHESRLDQMNMKNSIQEYLKTSLINIGIDEEYLLENWGKDPHVQEEVLEKLHYQILQVEDHCLQDPIFGKMRDRLSKELENAVQVYYKPPIDILDGTKDRHKERVNKRALKLSLMSPAVPSPTVILNQETMQAPRRRAHSESSSVDKNLPPLPFVKSQDSHRRAQSVLSFDDFKARFQNFARRRRRSSEASDSTATAESPASPQKKGFGIKKAFKSLLGKKSRDNSGLPPPPTKDYSHQRNDSIASSQVSYADSEVSESVLSATSDVDYSNPNRRVVYGQATAEPPLDVISETSETSSRLPSQSIISSNLSQSTHNDKDRVIDLSADDFDAEEDEEALQPVLRTSGTVQKVSEPVKSVVVVEDVQDFSESIEEISTNTAPQAQAVVVIPANTKPVIKPNASADSFDFSELSEVTDIKEGNDVNFSDDDIEIKEATVKFTPQAAVQSPDKSNEMNLSDLLDAFSDDEISHTKKPATKQPASKKKPAQSFEDEIDIEELDF